MSNLVPAELIENKIFLIRGQKVMMDSDLAKLYGVKTKVLIQAIKRNIDRFPEDFMFQMNRNEFGALRSQFVTSSLGGRRYLPYVFSEHGVAMLSSVLKTKKAIHVNIQIMRTFAKIRQILSTHKELAFNFAELERRTEKHDVEIQAIFEVIRKLMEPPPEKPKRRIGFI